MFFRLQAVIGKLKVIKLQILTHMPQKLVGNGKYYISSSLNELVLMNKKIGCYEIEKEQYHSFYSPEKIREYEKMIEKQKQ